MTTDELIAEITSGGFARYDESGLIDYLSLRTWIKAELKRFGSNITNLNEAVITIKDNQGKLPENFWNLNVALKCEPAYVTTVDEEKVLQDSLFFTERLEGTYEWDNASNSVQATPQSFIVEEFYFKGARATFHYNNPTYLRLTKGFNKSLCNSKSPNLRRSVVSDNPYEINITGNYVNTNFRDGSIYIQFYGLEIDDEGKLIIPETQHNRLKEYLIAYCRMRVLEEIYAGKDDDVANLLSYYNQKQMAAFGLALTETKMEALGKNWAQKIRNKQRLQSLKYDVMIPTR